MQRHILTLQYMALHLMASPLTANIGEMIENSRNSVAQLSDVVNKIIRVTGC